MPTFAQRLKTMKGFSLIELLVSMSILLLLFAIAFSSVGNLIPDANLDGAVLTLRADLREQQMKALTGYETITGGSSNYGIFFEQDRYTLFTGNSYIEGNQENYLVTLPEGLEINPISLPFESVVFAAKTGEVLNFNPDYSRITIRNVLSQQAQTLDINLLGVIDIL